MELLKQTALATFYILNLSPKTTPIKAVELGMCVARASEESGASVERITSIINHESQWNASARSQTNDHGLGQLHCPSKFCSRHPSSEELELLYDGCSNIEMMAQWLKDNNNLVERYNPGNPGHAVSIHTMERRLFDMWRKRSLERLTSKKWKAVAWSAN